MNTKVIMKNLILPVTRTVLLIVFMIFFSCKSEEDKISGGTGNFWDVIYIDNKVWDKPVQGYFFQSDGQFYAYHYYGKGRTPFDMDLGDHSTPPTIEANLKPWQILNDSVIKVAEREYVFKFAGIDTIMFKTGISVNPIIKLVRVTK